MTDLIVHLTDGRDTDIESLWDWLRSEPELHGLLRRGSLSSRPGVMGLGEIIVAVMSSGAAIALARSLAVWIRQQRVDLTVTVTKPNGAQASFTAKRVPDAQVLLANALEWADDDERHVHRGSVQQ